MVLPKLAPQRELVETGPDEDDGRAEDRAVLLLAGVEEADGRGVPILDERRVLLLRIASDEAESEQVPKPD